MTEATDWTDLARAGRTLEAIVAYRASAEIGLGEAKKAVERWVEVNLPPSLAYRRAVRVAHRLADRLAGYSAHSGRQVGYVISALAASTTEHPGYPSLLLAEMPVDGPGLDLAVEIELTGVPAGLRRRAVLENLARGIRMVWAIDVEDVTIRVATQPSRWSVWHDDGLFDGGEVLPGFSCKVSDLFG